MMKRRTHTSITSDISGELASLRKELPDVMSSFSSLASAATKDGALSYKTKEMIAMGIAIAARCDGCIGFHSQALVRLGVTREELVEVLGIAIYMGGGPSLMYAAEALSAFEEMSQNAAQK